MMRALTAIPRQRKSVRLEELPEPPVDARTVLVQTLAIGVCGTDREIIDGLYGQPPPGKERLILGHESLGRVLAADPDSGLAPGDLVVAIVRRPDPVPCANCACGEWDMCRNGLFTECGIKERDGFCVERYRIEPEYAVRIDPALERVGMLLEPASVVAKAWEHVPSRLFGAVQSSRIRFITNTQDMGANHGEVEGPKKEGSDQSDASHSGSAKKVQKAHAAAAP